MTWQHVCASLALLAGLSGCWSAATEKLTSLTTGHSPCSMKNDTRRPVTSKTGMAIVAVGSGVAINGSAVSDLAPLEIPHRRD
jgi:hypothetical protein